ncbi:MAG: hypothetical protein VXZ72_02170 [Chlamydiota bacterium]|nr:hypothetical protein [Chlamydiota bacterium]
MSAVFHETLEKAASVRIIRALHDAMDGAKPSKKTLSLLRKRGIIDAADDLDTIRGKVTARMRSMRKTVGEARRRAEDALDMDDKAGDFLDDRIVETRARLARNKPSYDPFGETKLEALKKRRTARNRMARGMDPEADPKSPLQKARRYAQPDSLTLRSRKDSAKELEFRPKPEPKPQPKPEVIGTKSAPRLESKPVAPTPPPRPRPRPMPDPEPRPRPMPDPEPSATGLSAPAVAPQAEGKKGINPLMVGAGIGTGAAIGTAAYMRRKRKAKEPLKKEAGLRSRLQSMRSALKQKFGKPKPNLVDRFQAQQQARAALKKTRFQDAMSSAMNKRNNNPVAMFKQQQAARAAAKKARFGEAVDAVRQRSNKTDLVARFKQEQAARAMRR